MIRFKDLSTPLKVGVVGGWIYFITSMLTFIIGFIIGLTGGDI